jgi:hypothetical protein
MRPFLSPPAPAGEGGHLLDTGDYWPSFMQLA